MNKPRLSICIATYNRAEYIGQTLDSIIRQITDDVEIVVVDGASTDNTENVVKKYAQSCNRLNYFKLPVKGGIDHDFCEAVEFAQGQYCWLFSDDDLIQAGGINAVLNEILKGYSLIIVNARVMNKELSTVLQERRLNVDKDQIYDESKFDLFFSCVISYLSFIGCVVINRDLWMQREKKRYFGTEFVHVGVIFQAPLPDPVLVLAQPYITIRLGNAQWTQRTFEIWMSKWPKLISTFTGIAEPVRRRYQNPQSLLRLKNIITFRATGVYTLKEYHKWFASEETALWWKMVVWLVAVIPACLVNLFMLSYFKIIKKDAMMVNIMKNTDNNIIVIIKKAACRLTNKRR
jgi:abequosyltransferase